MDGAKRDYKTKAKEAEKRAKQIYKEYGRFLKDNYKKDSSGTGYTDEALRESAKKRLSLAPAFEEAAKNYMAAKNLRKAIKYYGLASEYYTSVFSDFADSKNEKRDKVKYFKVRNTLERLEKVKKGKWHGLEGKIAATTFIISLIGGIFFLSSNITGNTIADLSTKTSSFLGAGLLIVGLVAGFFWLKNKNK